MGDIPDGYGLISGRSEKNAKAALDAAAAAGVDASEVRTATDGYLVPEKVLQKYEAALKSAPKSAADEPPPEKPAKKTAAPKKS